MADLAQKVNLGRALNQRAVTKALNMIQLTGKMLPASVTKVDGSIMTVKFEVGGDFTLPQVTIPLFGHEYTRPPIQQEDKGYVMAGDVDIGNMSGLGPKTPSGLQRPGNLSPLVFMPIGNKDWEESEDPDAILHYGKNGAIVRDKTKKSQVKVHPDSGASISTGTDVTSTDSSKTTNKITLDKDGASNGGITHSADKGNELITLLMGQGIKHKSSNKVDIEAPTHNVTAQTNITGDTNVTGNMGVSGLMSALGGMSFGGGGGGGGVSAGGAMSVSGPIAATAGAVSGTKLSTPVVHVAGLAGLSPAQGDRAYVDDATATTFHSIPVGGGTNAVPVNYDGTNWRIG